MRSFSFDGEIFTVPVAALPKIGDNPLVSVVLTTFHRTEQLRNTVRSLNAQTYKRLEIIVVEAGRENGETERLCDDFGIKYLQRFNVSDRRTAVTNNIGLRVASGEIVILQCAECRHEDSGNVEQLIAPILADSSVSTFPMVYDLDREGNRVGWKHHPETHPNCFITFCQAFSREAAEKIGGFDENFVGWGFEDNDFNWRLQYFGVKCVNVAALVAHQWHEKFPESERSTCGAYYNAQHEEIKAGKRSKVANEGRIWGDPNS